MNTINESARSKVNIKRNIKERKNLSISLGDILLINRISITQEEKSFFSKSKLWFKRI